MSTFSPMLGPMFLVPPFPVRRFTVDEYHRMIAAGILTEDDAVELLSGWITPKMPRNPTHDGTIDRTDDALRPLLPAGWRLRIQSAITTATSEPEPDLAVVLQPASRYLTHHPGSGEIALLVEVADSSLSRDRNEKASAYAEASVPVYWIVNIIDLQVEVYSDPTGPCSAPAYRHRQDFPLGAVVPVQIAGQVVGQVPVASLLG